MDDTDDLNQTWALYSVDNSPAEDGDLTQGRIPVFRNDSTFLR